MKIIMKLLIILPIIFLVLSFVATEFNKAYWDSKVKEMCEKDGGITVFETVYMPIEEYLEHSWGNNVFITPPYTDRYSSKYLYFASYHKEIIKSGFPKVYRRVTKIFRKNDKTILGEQVHYRRVAGDFPTIIMHPSGFGCKESSNLRPLINEIFHIKGDL